MKEIRIGSFKDETEPQVTKTSSGIRNKLHVKGLNDFSNKVGGRFKQTVSKAFESDGAQNSTEPETEGNDTNLVPAMIHPDTPNNNTPLENPRRRTTRRLKSRLHELNKNSKTKERVNKLNSSIKKNGSVVLHELHQLHHIPHSFVMELLTQQLPFIPLLNENTTSNKSSVKTLLVCSGQIKTDMFQDVDTPSQLMAPVLSPSKLAKKIVDRVNSGKDGELFMPFYTHFIPLLKAFPSQVIKAARKVSGMDNVFVKPQNTQTITTESVQGLCNSSFGQEVERNNGTDCQEKKGEVASGSCSVINEEAEPTMAQQEESEIDIDGKKVEDSQDVLMVEKSETTNDERK